MGLFRRVCTTRGPVDWFWKPDQLSEASDDAGQDSAQSRSQRLGIRQRKGSVCRRRDRSRCSLSSRLAALLLRLRATGRHVRPSDAAALPLRAAVGDPRVQVFDHGIMFVAREKPERSTYTLVGRVSTIAIQAVQRSQGLRLQPIIEERGLESIAVVDQKLM